MTRLRAAVLASGGGSNLQALLEYLHVLGEQRALDVVLVASDRADAGALRRARDAGIAVETLRSSREPAGAELPDVLSAHAIDLVVLAGWLRLVPADVIQRFRWRILNVHPGPLPAFGGAGMYGSRVHRAVLAARVAFSGPTVHYVDEIFDHGDQLAHWPVPVLADDDERTLGERVLRAEHLLYPRVVQVVARRLTSATDPVARRTTLVLRAFDPGLDSRALARQVDTALDG